MAGKMRVARLAGNIGAEITGISIAQHLDDVDIGQVRRALLDHKVVFLRGQGLDRGSHVAFARSLGSLMLGQPLDEDPAEGSFLRPIDSREGGRADSWHTDMTFVLRPPAFSVLRAIIVPPLGGDTVWANTVTAYASLTPELRSLADQLRIIHSTESDHADATGGSGLDDIYEAEHPAVRVHPETGERALLVGGYARRVVGLGTQASRDVIRLLQDQVTKPEHTVRWRWQQDDLAIWDNQATQHYAIRDYGNDHRRTERVTVAGSVPVGVDGRLSVALLGDALAFSAPGSARAG